MPICYLGLHFEVITGLDRTADMPSALAVLPAVANTICEAQPPPMTGRIGHEPQPPASKVLSCSPGADAGSALRTEIAIWYEEAQGPVEGATTIVAPMWVRHLRRHAPTLQKLLAPQPSWARPSTPSRATAPQGDG